MTYCNPKLDLGNVEDDFFTFICLLRLIYHFTDINKNGINPGQSLLNPQSTWSQPFTKNKEFEDLIRNSYNIVF